MMYSKFVYAFLIFFVVDNDGNIMGMGDNEYGQLVPGSKTTHVIPTLLPAFL